MNRSPVTRRQQQRPTPRPTGSGIPGWIWGIAVGAIGALIAVGIVTRSNTSHSVEEQSENVTTTPTPTPIPPETLPSQPQPQPETVPSQQKPVAGAPASREEEIEKLRQQIDELRRKNEPAQNEPAPVAAPEVVKPTEAVREQPADPRHSALEQSAQAEAEWRPIFSEFQKRYSEKKGESDKLIDTLKQVQAQCNYTQMGEPTEAQKRKGVRQEGLPSSLVQGMPVGYGASCETVDKDLRKAQQEKFEALRDVQDECYQEAVARGVSTAKAKLR